MIIPEKLQIVGRIFDVKFDNEHCIEHDAYGQADYRRLTIWLADTSGKNKLAKQNIEINFLHEIVHMIFWVMEHQELNKDENLVNRVAECLHQILPQICPENKTSIIKE